MSMNVGDNVITKEREGINVLRGKVTEINGDKAVVDFDGIGEWQINLSDLEIVTGNNSEVH